jgi:kynurenine formamidase
VTASNLSELLERSSIVDLSQPTFAGCPGWPTYPPTVLESHATIERDGFNAERLDLITHTGTHLDVPYHFFADGKKLDEVPVGDFQGPAAVLDLRPLRPEQGIGPAELEASGQLLRPGDIAILCTGWSEKRGPNPEFLYRWPYLTGDGARWQPSHAPAVGCVNLVLRNATDGL